MFKLLSKINTLGYLFYSIYYGGSKKKECICWEECSMTCGMNVQLKMDLDGGVKFLTGRGGG